MKGKEDCFIRRDKEEKEKVYKSQSREAKVES